MIGVFNPEGLNGVSLMRILRASGLALGVAGAFLTIAASPARADRNDWHHGGHPGWHGHPRQAYVAPYYAPRYYAPPPVYYQPPPAYYAPPPVYYGSPSVTFSFR